MAVVERLGLMALYRRCYDREHDLDFHVMAAAADDETADAMEPLFELLEQIAFASSGLD